MIEGTDLYDSNSDYLLVGETTENDFSLAGVVTALRRRAWLVGIMLAVGLGSGFYFFQAATPVYEAFVTVQIERDTQVLDFEQLFQTDSTNDSFYQTQYELIQSRSLARRVIEQENLLESAEFADALAGRRSRGLLGWLKAPLTWVAELTGILSEDSDAPQEAAAPSPAQLQARTRLLADLFLRRLTVSPIRNTRLAVISWSATSPGLAARVTNAIADEYIEMSVEAKYESAVQVNQMLQGSIDQLRAEIDAASRELEEERQNLEGPGTGAGGVADGPTVEALRDRIVDTEFERMEKQSSYQRLRTIEDPANLPEVGADPDVEALKEEKASLQDEYTELTRRFTPEHPDVQHVVGQLEELDERLRREQQRVLAEMITSARHEYEVVADKERTLRGLLAERRRETHQNNEDLIDIQSLEMELENKNNLLETMIARQGETNVTARMQALRAPNVRVAERAAVPAAPSHPNLITFLLVPGFLGLVAGVGAAVARERLDDTAHTPSEVETQLGLPNLATVPSLKDLGRRRLLPGGFEAQPPYGSEYRDYRGIDVDYERDVASTEAELITMKYPRSGFSEAYRALRTRVLRSGPGPAPKSMLVTSAKPGEGKTTCAVNLAAALARVGKKILLIDGDLRRPRLHRVMECDPRRGLVHFLDRGAPLEDLVQETAVEGLSLLVCGPCPSNPSELLSTDRTPALLEVAGELFDAVIIDSPPILATVDPLILASHVDGVLVVVRGRVTPIPVVEEACTRIEEVGGEIFGVLLNEGETDIRRRPPRYRGQRTYDLNRAV